MYIPFDTAVTDVIIGKQKHNIQFSLYEDETGQVDCLALRIDRQEWVEDDDPIYLGCRDYLDIPEFNVNNWPAVNQWVVDRLDEIFSEWEEERQAS